MRLYGITQKRSMILFGTGKHGVGRSILGQSRGCVIENSPRGFAPQHPLFSHPCQFICLGRVNYHECQKHLGHFTIHSLSYWLGSMKVKKNCGEICISLCQAIQVSIFSKSWSIRSSVTRGGACPEKVRCTRDEWS